MRMTHRGEAGALARAFPEKTLTIRSAAGTRCLRLGPGAQVTLAAAALLLTVWTTVATGLVAVGAWRDLGNEGALASLSQRYEARIAALETRAAALAGAEARGAAAVAALAARHDAVSNGLASGQALSASVEHLRLRVATLAAERDALLATAAASSGRIAELEGALQTAEAEQRDLAEALSRVAQMLDLTAGARDGALAEVQLAEGALGELEAGVEQRRDINSRLLAQIEAAAARSIGPLERLFGSLGLDADALIEGLPAGRGGQGGPFVPEPETIAALEPEEGARVTTVLSQLERVALLRDAALRLPLGMPVRNVRKTSGFGPRRDPMNGRRAMHEGVDFSGAIGTPITAAADGIVTFAGVQSGYGRLVKIRHANGFETLYAHLHRVRVSAGESVRRGERVGDLGNTGRSTGPHLHYEVRRNGRPLNPMKFIEAARHVL